MIYNTIHDIPDDVLARGGTIQVRTLPPGFTGERQAFAVSRNRALVPISGSDPNTWILPPLAIFLIKLIMVGVVICVIIVTTTGLVNAIKAIPQAKKLEEYADGSSVWQAADGTMMHFDKDGYATKLTDPPANDWEQLTQLAYAGVAVVVVIVILYIVIKFLPLFKRERDVLDAGLAQGTKALAPTPVAVPKNKDLQELAAA